MKKYAILFLAGAMISLASCGDNQNTDTQAQIDSAANARSAAMEAELKATNDSLINAMAMMKADSAARADSMAKAFANRSSGSTSRANTIKPAKPVPAKPATIGNGKPAMGGNNTNGTTIGQGKPKMGNQNNTNTIGQGKPKMGENNK